MKKFAILGLLALLLATGVAVAATVVTVYQDEATFVAATGAAPLPFPSSADTAFPNKPFGTGYHDYSCIPGGTGINLGDAVTVKAVNLDWICFLGPGWNAGLGNINPTPTSPTIVVNREDDYLLVNFASPVYAVGFKLLTNKYASETITLTFADGALSFLDTALGTAPNTFEFVGFKSDTPIVSVKIDTTGGAEQNEGIAGIWVNTPPTISVNDATKEGDTTGGWILEFSDIGSASDAEDGTPSVSCTPAIGSVLPLGATVVNCTATDSGGLTASDLGTVTVVDTTDPAITCPADFNGTVGQAVSLGSPVVSDIVDPDPDVTNNAPPSFPPGATTVIWTATDASGNSNDCTQKVTLTYDFSGFFRPIDNEVLNVAKAGSAIPVKFSLSGYQGLEIFKPGYPLSRQITCDTTLHLDGVEETVTAGSSSLSYDPTVPQYIYVWKTDKLWANSCRRLVVRLFDGTEHVADFSFKK
jgi:hypothetical protein